MIGVTAYDRLIFRGDTLVSLEPQGKNYPYYQREYFRQATAPLKRVVRFILRPSDS